MDKRTWKEKGHPIHIDGKNILSKINCVCSKKYLQNVDFGYSGLFTAIKDIYPGQELFIDYGDEYWTANKEEEEAAVKTPLSEDRVDQAEHDNQTISQLATTLVQQFPEFAGLDDTEREVFMSGEFGMCDVAADTASSPTVLSTTPMRNSSIVSSAESLSKSAL